MSEMVKKVARALSGADDPDGRQWYAVNPEYWETLARAAIEAMRKPTHDMVGVGIAALDDENAISVWQAMLDEVLK